MRPIVCKYRPADGDDGFGRRTRRCYDQMPETDPDAPVCRECRAPMRRWCGSCGVVHTPPPAVEIPPTPSLIDSNSSNAPDTPSNGLSVVDVTANRERLLPFLSPLQPTDDDPPGLREVLATLRARRRSLEAQEATDGG
eukprot:TRINITY_DN5738_c0_g1_i1.p1 TRINITY_DN5738_c0_g1~~TRINITY_DN5738_c0_g1_i1.p1  ORF type:complete len:139 (-),score=6.05 TRINITY_DN5738_c0_g1_i1:167-583(-)